MPVVSVGATYESNPRYARDSRLEDDVVGMDLDARLNASWRTAKSGYQLTPRFHTSFYGDSDFEDLETDDYYLDGRAQWSFARSAAGLSAGASRVGLRTSEFASATPDDPLAGGGSGRLVRVDQERDSLYLNPYWIRDLSPRNQLSLSGSYLDAEYDRKGAPSGFFDYRFSNFDASLIHAVTEKNRLSLGFSAVYYDADQPDSPLKNESDSYGLNFGFDRSLSESSSLALTLGYSETTSTASGLNFDPRVPLPPPLDGFLPCLEPNGCKSRAKNTNFIGKLSYRRTQERDTLIFEASTFLAPQSNGGQVVRDQVFIYVDRALTRRLSGSIGLRAYQEDSVRSSEVSDLSSGRISSDRTYIRVEPTLRWTLSRNWSLRASYTYTSSDYKTSLFDQGKADNHRVFTGIVYTGTGIGRR